MKAPSALSPLLEPVTSRLQRSLGQLRTWRDAAELAYSKAQARAQGSPRVLEGELLGSLRSQLIERREIYYRAGISNAGLLAYGDGYLAVVKNNTYCFCREHGIESDFGPTDLPAKSGLLQVQLDRAFNVTDVKRLTLAGPASAADDPSDLHEDARLTRVESQIWCSLNVVPGGQQWSAMPRVGKLDVASGTVHAERLVLPKAPPPQKNWLPFNHEGQLHLEFSVNPHVVFRVNRSADGSSLRHSSFFLTPYFGLRAPFFRGGSPLVPFEGHYLGTAHSMVHAAGRRDYRTHFFLTEARAPFGIRFFGEPLKLLRSERIQYVSGTVVTADGGVIVSYGMDDCDNLFARVSASELRASLRRVR